MTLNPMQLIYAFHALLSQQENQDPRKISPLLELMMDNPLNGDGGSFGDSRLVT